MGIVFEGKNKNGRVFLSKGEIDGVDISLDVPPSDPKKEYEVTIEVDDGRARLIPKKENDKEVSPPESENSSFALKWKSDDKGKFSWSMHPYQVIQAKTLKKMVFSCKMNDREPSLFRTLYVFPSWHQRLSVLLWFFSALIVCIALLHLYFSGILDILDSLTKSIFGGGFAAIIIGGLFSFKIPIPQFFMQDKLILPWRITRTPLYWMLLVALSLVIFLFGIWYKYEQYSFVKNKTDKPVTIVKPYQEDEVLNQNRISKTIMKQPDKGQQYMEIDGVSFKIANAESWYDWSDGTSINRGIFNFDVKILSCNQNRLGKYKTFFGDGVISEENSCKVKDTLTLDLNDLMSPLKKELKDALALDDIGGHGTLKFVGLEKLAKKMDEWNQDEKKEKSPLRELFKKSVRYNLSSTWTNLQVKTWIDTSYGLSETTLSAPKGTTAGPMVAALSFDATTSSLVRFLVNPGSNSKSKLSCYLKDQNEIDIIQVAIKADYEVPLNQKENRKAPIINIKNIVFENVFELSNIDVTSKYATVCLPRNITEIPQGTAIWSDENHHNYKTAVEFDKIKGILRIKQTCCLLGENIKNGESCYRDYSDDCITKNDEDEILPARGDALRIYLNKNRNQEIRHCRCFVLCQENTETCRKEELKVCYP